MENLTVLESTRKSEKNLIGIIHRAYLTFLKNSRSYTASTKTKSEIRGGGRKPWKQKGTGKARSGSSRSPLWVGGGVIFGPKPRIVSKKINKKERQLAILAALKLKNQRIINVDDNYFKEFSVPKTKEVINLLNGLNITSTSKILFILPESNQKFWLAARNLNNVQITTTSTLNLQQILAAENIIISSLSLNVITTKYGNRF